MINLSDEKREMYVRIVLYVRMCICGNNKNNTRIQDDYNVLLRKQNFCIYVCIRRISRLARRQKNSVFVCIVMEICLVSSETARAYITRNDNICRISLHLSIAKRAGFCNSIRILYK